jgi:hypothetical protein
MWLYSYWGLEPRYFGLRLRHERLNKCWPLFLLESIHISEWSLSSVALYHKEYTSPYSTWQNARWMKVGITFSFALLDWWFIILPFSNGCENTSEHVSPMHIISHDVTLFYFLKQLWIYRIKFILTKNFENILCWHYKRPCKQ